MVYEEKQYVIFVKKYFFLNVVEVESFTWRMQIRFGVNVFTMQDRTNNLFKQVYEQKSLKGRANDAIASACLYIACRQEGVPRTFKGQSEPFYFLLLLMMIDGSKSKQIVVFCNMW